MEPLHHQLAGQQQLQVVMANAPQAHPGHQQWPDMSALQHQQAQQQHVQQQIDPAQLALLQQHQDPQHLSMLTPQQLATLTGALGSTDLAALSGALGSNELLQRLIEAQPSADAAASAAASGAEHQQHVNVELPPAPQLDSSAYMQGNTADGMQQGAAQAATGQVVVQLAVGDFAAPAPGGPAQSSVEMAAQQYVQPEAAAGMAIMAGGAPMLQGELQVQLQPQQQQQQQGAKRKAGECLLAWTRAGMGSSSSCLLNMNHMLS